MLKMTLRVTSSVLSYIPLQGSFFTKNSSSAIHPPPTRTITVLRKIRTRRSCWESPNCVERQENMLKVSFKVQKLNVRATPRISQRQIGSLIISSKIIRRFHYIHGQSPFQVKCNCINLKGSNEIAGGDR